MLQSGRNCNFFHLMWRNLSTVTRDPLPFDAIPGPKPLPVVGNLWRYLPVIGNYKPDTLFENAQYNKSRYGPIVREYLTKNHTILHLFDPTDVEAFFRQDSGTPHRRSHRALLKYRQSESKLYNDGGLFPENGPSWSRLRSLFQVRLMSKEQLSLRTPLLDKITLQTIEKLGNDRQQLEDNTALARETDNFQSGGVSGRSIKIRSLNTILSRWSLRCSLATFLDFDEEHEVDPELENQLLSSLHGLLEAIDGTELQSERWLRAPSKCPFYKKLSKCESFLYEFVSERVDHLTSNKCMGQVSFLSDWLQVDKLDRKDVKTLIVDLILAGQHTMTYTTTFLLYNIAKADGGQLIEALLREIDAHLPSTDIAMDASDKTRNLQLLRDCLRETLRMNPVSIGTGRLTQRDEMCIRNYRVPKNVMIIVQSQVIARNPDIYEDPDIFKPERWAHYRSLPRDQRPSPFAWLPYGFGPRACIGQRLANLQIHIFVARLLQRFEVQSVGAIETRTTLVHNICGDVGMVLRYRY